MKKGTPAFRPISCSLRTINIMSVVEQFGRNPHCSSGKQKIKIKIENTNKITQTVETN